MAIKLSLVLLGLIYLYSVQTRQSFLAVWTMIMSSQQYRRVNMSESPIISRKVTLRTSYSKGETNLLLIVFKWTYICLSKWNIHSTLSEKRIVYHCPRLIKLSLRASKYYKQLHSCLCRHNTYLRLISKLKLHLDTYENKFVKPLHCIWHIDILLSQNLYHNQCCKKKI